MVQRPCLLAVKYQEKKGNDRITVQMSGCPWREGEGYSWGPAQVPSKEFLVLCV